MTSANRAGAAAGAGPIRVLVVEDEPLVAIMLEEALKDSGYAVVGPVENLKAAIQLAATERIDTAIVDINIDGQIATTVADRLMERGIPFLFVSGYPRELGLRYRNIPLLSKPFTFADLHYAIERRLNRAPLRNPTIG